MTRYRWREGAVPPKTIDAEVFGSLLDASDDPSPDALFEASKDESHVLHEDLWSEGDQVWANRGRIARVRQIIGMCHKVEVHFGKEISTRVVEFIRPNGPGRWMQTDAIRLSPEFMDAYIREIIRLQEQATDKMSKVQSLLQPEE